jgi:hypothetical protein
MHIHNPLHRFCAYWSSSHLLLACGNFRTTHVWTLYIIRVVHLSSFSEGSRLNGDPWPCTKPRACNIISLVVMIWLLTNLQMLPSTLLQPQRHLRKQISASETRMVQWHLWLYALLCVAHFGVNSTDGHWTCNVCALKSLNLQNRLTDHWTCILRAHEVTNRSTWRFFIKISQLRVTCIFWAINSWHMAL